MGYRIGRSEFRLNAVMVRQKHQVRAELYISGVRAKAFFGLLQRQRAAIEEALGYPLDWDALPEGQDSRISVSLENADPENTADWKRQHEWLAARLTDIYRVFVDRVRVLDADDWRPEGSNASESATNPSPIESGR
jgi:hypothetical protein